MLSYIIVCMEGKVYIKFDKVKKIYSLGEQEIVALEDMNFNIEQGEFAIIVGQSGAGKTTVLNILGAMDDATEGAVIIDGEDITKYNEEEATLYRRSNVGFVFQFYNLIQNLTAIENIQMASELAKESLDSNKILSLVGLEHRASNFPSQLSGGEQQRVAIGRALAKNPKLLLCDEPTGALDYNTGKMILDLLYKICKEENKTVVVITHNQAIVPMADRVITVKNGKAISNEINENPINIKDIEW